MDNKFNTNRRPKRIYEQIDLLILRGYTRSPKLNFCFCRIPLVMSLLLTVLWNLQIAPKYLLILPLTTAIGYLCGGFKYTKMGS